MLVSLGYVIRKVFGLISGTGSIDYWKAPDGLAPEKMKEIDINKIINKKKRKKGKNETIRSEYKRPRSRRKIYLGFQFFIIVIF